MKRDEILEILVDWNYWGNYEDGSLERERYLKRLKHLQKAGEITVIKGVRRAGKSTLISQFVGKTLEDMENSLIVNFEDPRFRNLSSEVLNKIYEVYLDEMNPGKKPWVVLDEVQEVEGWERFARFLHESKGAKVFITGSSSKLLSEEYSTHLAGRHVDLEIFPLSFREFLRFKGLEVGKKVEVVKARHRIKNALKEFIEFGGFPKVALVEEGKEEILKNYFRDILIKDVQRRFDVRETGKLEDLAKYYLTNIANLQSFNKVKEVANLSLDTVERFSEYFSIARVLFFVPKFSFSYKKQVLNPKKVYAIDTGLRNVVSFQFSEDLGKLYENLVFLELFKEGKDIYYWKGRGGREVDFVVKKGKEVEQLVQVCYDVEDEATEKRERKGLERAMEEFGLDEGLVITKDRSDKEVVGSKEIIYKPLWKWLLENG